MKVLKKLMKFILVTFLSMGVVSLVIFTLHYIPVGEYTEDGEYEIYLHDNGKHLDIIIPNKHQNRYKAYGWGSKIFFMEVPTWDDLTCKIALQALFTKPESCMRIEYYSELNPKWKKVNVTWEQLKHVQFMINQAFDYNKFGHPICIRDNFYKAKGSYWALNTCNTWVNTIFKKVGLKAKAYTLTSNALSELY